MRLKEYDIDPVNVNLTGYASNVTGDAFVLTANNSGDGLARQVSIRNDTGNSHSGKTIDLVGTDPDGYALSESVTGPGSSATVESAEYFLTLTSATPSATIGADTFDIGWVDEVSTQTIPLNWRSTVGALINVDVTGTIDFTVQETFDNVLRGGQTPQSAYANVQWLNISALATKTADTTSSATVGATAIRLVINSYTDTAEIQMHVNQAAH